MATFWSDEFTDGDLVAAGWVARAGTWQAVSGAADCPSGAGTLTRDAGVTDHRIRAVIRTGLAGEDHDAGVVARWFSATGSPAHAFAIGAAIRVGDELNELELYSVLGGTDNARVSWSERPFEYSSDYQLELEVQGDVARVFLDGDQVIDYQLTGQEAQLAVGSNGGLRQRSGRSLWLSAAAVSPGDALLFDWRTLVDAARLRAFVGAGPGEHDELIADCVDEAAQLCSDFAAGVQVPMAAARRAVLEVAADLFHRRNAPNGVQQFALVDGGYAPQRIARDPMAPAYPLLRRYVMPL